MKLKQQEVTWTKKVSYSTDRPTMYPNNKHELDQSNLLVGYRMLSESMAQIFAGEISLKPNRRHYAAPKDFDLAMQEHRERIHTLDSISREYRQIVEKLEKDLEEEEDDNGDEEKNLDQT